MSEHWPHLWHLCRRCADGCDRSGADFLVIVLQPVSHGAEDLQVLRFQSMLL